MKKTRLIIAMVISFGLFACNNKTVEVSADQTEVSVEAEHHHNHDDHSEALMLNNGERWAVNVEMIPFVEKGQELLNDYIVTQGTDYKALASQMKEQNSQLIKSCTMDGKSHDELHKWLHPHLELVTALENAADQDEANKIINELKESYNTYAEYFK
jgi:GH15 family glucan-1,4-alpha-glucosidase